MRRDGEIMIFSNIVVLQLSPALLKHFYFLLYFSFLLLSNFSTFFFFSFLFYSPPNTFILLLLFPQSCSSTF